mgnify:CR=1 FL=1
MTFRIGLIGYGGIGRVHAQTLAQRVPGARLLAITDVNAQAAESAAADFGIPQVAPDYDALLADDRIGAVVICSATDTHAPFITQAARAGKHIFCEKPIAADLGVIDAALAAVKQWEYRPTRVKGVAVPVIVNVAVDFKP